MFIALRHLNTSDGPVKPGDHIPSADGWPHGVQISSVNVGHVFDLTRRVKLDASYGPTVHKRERQLLERLPQFGKQVIEQDGVYTVHDLTPADPEQGIPADDEQPEALQRNVVESRVGDEPPRRRGRGRG